MKKREMKATLEAMKVVRVPKIENKELRNKFIRVHLKLLKEEKKYEDEMEDAQVVFLSAYGEEQAKVGKLQEAMRAETNRAKQEEIAREIETHSEFLDAVKEFNEKAAEMGREVVELEPLDMAEFVEEYEKQGYDPGVVEGLFPLFAE